MNTQIPKKNVVDKKKICFIAQFPPPLHGLSKAVDTLYNSELALEFDFEKIDITDNKKIIWNLWKVGQSKADLFYFTISQTKIGNLRDLLILKLLELRHKKCIIHLHGGYYRTLVEYKLPSWQKYINYKIVHHIEGVIVLGRALRWIFEGMIAENKIYIVPNCVDDDYLLSDKEFEDKIKTVSTKTIKHVLYLSNFIKSKGYPEVLKMAAIEKQRCEAGKQKQLHFDFAGKFFKKEDEKFFWTYITEHQLEDYVTYHGIVDGCKKRELLKFCDIFILLTRYPKEGQPISILEAMGNGMIIVTTNYAGISDIVKDKVNGIVIDAKSPIFVDDIYQQLLSMDIVNIGKKNHLDVSLKFTQADYINNMKNIFDLIFK